MARTERPVIMMGADADDELRVELARRYDVYGPLALPFADSIAAFGLFERKRVRAIVVRGSMPLTRAAIALLPNLQLISCIGAGYEGIDLEGAHALGIAVTNSPGANASSVADLALGLTIGVARRVFEANALLRQGEWPKQGRQHGHTVAGLTNRRMGIYGLGTIGEKIAQRATACEMSVGYHNRRQRTAVGYAYFPSLLDLARWADVLVVAVRPSNATHHAVNREVLAALGPRAYLVNIARGTVVDEAAMIEALRNGTIAGAGLDVFENEPEISPSLLSLPNVLATPHMAGNTEHGWMRMQQMVLANVDAMFSGSPLPNLLRPDDLTNSPHR